MFIVCIDLRALVSHFAIELALFCRKAFASRAYLFDFLYHVLMLCLMSAYVIVAPVITSKHLDKNGCPINITDEEAANATILQFHYEVGVFLAPFGVLEECVRTTVDHSGPQWTTVDHSGAQWTKNNGPTNPMT